MRATILCVHLLRFLPPFLSLSLSQRRFCFALTFFSPDALVSFTTSSGMALPFVAKIFESRDAFFHTIGALRAAASRNTPPTSSPPTKTSSRRPCRQGERDEGDSEGGLRQRPRKPIAFDYLLLATSAVGYSVEAFRPSSDKLEDILKLVGVW